MKKINVLWLLLISVFVVAFNAIFFLVGVSHNATAWLCYVFIHISYVMTVITPMLTAKSRNFHIFGRTLISISTVFFFAEFTIGAFCILIGSQNWRTPFVIQLLLLSVYLILLILNLIMNEKAAGSMNAAGKNDNAIVVVEEPRTIDE